jgi:hypothetical protein
VLRLSCDTARSTISMLCDFEAVWVWALTANPEIDKNKIAKNNDLKVFIVVSFRLRNL